MNQPRNEPHRPDRNPTEPLPVVSNPKPPSAASGKPRWSRRLLFTGVWAGVALAATATGIFAVNTISETALGQGPKNAQAVRALEVAAEPGTVPHTSTPASGVETFEFDYGTVVVSCQGVVALGESAEGKDGWVLTDFDRGPDDDVSAEFERGNTEVEVSFFCNNGQPHLDEEEFEPIDHD